MCVFFHHGRRQFNGQQYREKGTWSRSSKGRKNCKPYFRAECPAWTTKKKTAIVSFCLPLYRRKQRCPVTGGFPARFQLWGASLLSAGCKIEWSKRYSCWRWTLRSQGSIVYISRSGSIRQRTASSFFTLPLLDPSPVWWKTLFARWRRAWISWRQALRGSLASKERWTLPF